MVESTVYANPRVVTDLGECYFYHTMDIPGYGTTEGEWDLRKGVKKYLGKVDFKGKRVLEIGTASGFLCFYMESRGAEVVAYDLSENQSWDIYPGSKYDYNQLIINMKDHIRKINNAYWLCHRVYGSKAKKVHGTVYTVPREIGPVDISTFCSVLLHVRDPFLALQNALRLTRETVIITDMATACEEPHMVFLSDPEGLAWWNLPPAVIEKFIGAMGFEDTKVKYHYQKRKGDKYLLYTLVGHRTKEIQDL